MKSDEPEFEAGRRQTSGFGFFGRRIGKPLRQHQSELIQNLLPQLTVNVDKAKIDLSSIFDGPVKTVHLEIGFGGGEHLIAEAVANPEIGFIGCEAFINGVAKILNVIDQRKIRNIRLFPGDVLDLLPVLPEASISRLYVLYPDPWPKPRQRKRRIVSDVFIESIAHVLQPGANFLFATDIDDYSAWTLARMLRSEHFEWTASLPSDWLNPWDGWTGTRYEAKAFREQRQPAYLTFHRR